MDVILFQMFPDIIINPADAFMISLVANLIIGAVLFIILLFGYSPVAFVRAKMGKKLILLVAGRDRLLDLVVGTAKGGVVRTKRYGDYAIIPKTTYITPSGFRAGIVYEPLATTIPMEMAQNAGKLREAGIESFGQFGAAEEQISKEKNKIDQLSKHATPEQRAMYAQQLKSIDRVTLSIDEIKNFFQWNLNPHVMAEAISRATLEGIQDWKKLDIMKWAFALLFLFMGFALAYVIIMSVAAPAGAGAGGAGFLGGGLV